VTKVTAQSTLKVRRVSACDDARDKDDWILRIQVGNQITGKLAIKMVCACMYVCLLTRLLYIPVESRHSRMLVKLF